MALALRLGLLLVGATVVLGDPDFYSAWCPCQPQRTCPNYYGRFFDDVLIFGSVPVCDKYGYVRCCSADNIPEGFDLERQVEYFPESVEPQRAVVQQAIAVREALNAANAADSQEVHDFKAAQEKLKRDIANGIDNPNPPCGCYTAGTCPGRYATKSTGRDIGCLSGFETCCFLDDPWPNYEVTNMTILSPCSTAATCALFFGTSPFDISNYGALEPCYLGQNRCLDYLVDGSDPQPSRVRPPTQPAPTEPTYRPAPTTRATQRPTYAPAPQPTYAPAPRPTYRPAPQPTYAPAPRPTYAPVPRPTYRPAPRPTTARPTYRPRATTTYRPRPQPTYQPRPQPTYRPRPQPTYAPRPRPTYRPQTTTTYRPRTTTYRPRTTTYRPTTTTYRTTTRKSSEPQPADSIFDIVANGAYLPPSAEFGSADVRTKNIDAAFALPF